MYVFPQGYNYEENRTLALRVCFPALRFSLLIKI